MDAPVPGKENENTTDVAKTEDSKIAAETKTPEAKDETASPVVSQANDNKVEEPASVAPEDIKPAAQSEAKSEAESEAKSEGAQTAHIQSVKIEGLKVEAAAVVTPEEKSTIIRSLKFKPAPEPRWRRTLEEHGYKAAGLFVAIGAGWIIGAHSFAPAPHTREIVDALNAVTTRLEHVEQFTTRLNAQTQEIAGLKTALASMRSVVEANRAEAQVASAQLAIRIANQPQTDLTPITRRLDQLESAAQARPVAQVETPRTEPPRAEPVRARIPPNGFVLRRVVGGTALVETANGVRQVMVGDYLPGAGRVRAIERRGREWVVVTSAGIIDTQSY